MVKKTITYLDFNNDTISEDFFFHLTKAELVELEMSYDGGLSAQLERIVKAEDNAKLISEFKNIILLSYGKKSEDDRRFIKTQELRDEFASSEAYSALFMELVTDADAAIAFVNGLVPAGMVEEAAKVVQTSSEKESKTKSDLEVITREEFEEMSQEEKAKVAVRIASGEVELKLGLGD